MDIQTTFSCGDKAWVYLSEPTLVTVGQVRIEITESPGVEQVGIEFDNFKAKSSRVETYMCVETGIGSGNVWELGKSIFRTKKECIAANIERIRQREKDEHERLERENLALLARENSLRSQLARIEKLKASGLGIAP